MSSPSLMGKMRGERLAYGVATSLTAYVVAPAPARHASPRACSAQGEGCQRRAGVGAGRCDAANREQLRPGRRHADG